MKDREYDEKVEIEMIATSTIAKYAYEACRWSKVRAEMKKGPQYDMKSRWKNFVRYMPRRVVPYLTSRQFLLYLLTN